VVKVTAGGLGRVSIAGLACYRIGQRSRLIYRLHVYHRRKGETASYTETDYARLLDAAHQQLGTPLVLVWGNLSRHTSAKMRALLANRSWLAVFRLPSYAPELNPAEAIWANLRTGLTNLAPRRGGIDELAALVRTRLKRMQYRTDGLIDSFLAETGLTLEPP
jgi:putative transposase